MQGSNAITAFHSAAWNASKNITKIPKKRHWLRKMNFWIFWKCIKCPTTSSSKGKDPYTASIKCSTIAKNRSANNWIDTSVASWTNWSTPSSTTKTYSMPIASFEIKITTNWAILTCYLFIRQARSSTVRRSLPRRCNSINNTLERHRTASKNWKIRLEPFKIFFSSRSRNRHSRWNTMSVINLQYLLSIFKNNNSQLH